jgi:hypothetical protein
VTGLGVWAITRGGSGSGTSITPVTSSEPSTTDAPVSVGTDATDSGNAGTFVITAPEASPSSLAPRDTGVPETAAAGDRLVADDTGVFTVSVPNDFEVDTAPVDANGEQVAQVMAAVDLSKFRSDFVTVGYIVNALPDFIAATPHDAILLAGPRDQDCTNLSAETDVDTAVGPAVVQTAQGCGPESGTVAVMALVDSSSGLAFVVYAQGGGDVASVRTLAQTVLESVYLS